MVFLGLALIALGALVILAALVTASVEAGHVEIIGLQSNAVTLFLLGVAAGAAILFGIGILKFGTRRSLNRRRESKRMDQLASRVAEHDRARGEGRGGGTPPPPGPTA